MAERYAARGLPPGGRVDAVEPSPHDAAKAYIAVLRYQFGDWSPYIYRTEDFGRRWQLLTDGRNGIPANFPTRVVREDPVKEGLLFAGTEYGIFVSLDDGENWHAFQQNLGVTPVTDIKIVRSDLAISTMGRSFWVLDNISTLRQDAFRNSDIDIAVFKPKDTIRYRNVYRSNDEDVVPHYPPPAVVIDYRLPEEVPETIRLDILDASGAIVNSYQSVIEEDDESRDVVVEDMNLSQETVIADESLSNETGMNRFRWNMKHLGAWHEEEEERFKDGPLARPGTYSARLTVGDYVMETSFDLLADPRVLEQGTSLDDVNAQVDLSLRLVEMLTEARQLEKRLSDEKEEFEEKGDAISDSDQQRLDQLNAVLSELKTEDIIYPQPMLTDQISYLYNMINTADQAPGKEAEDRFEVLTTKLLEILASAAD
jgi:hypothetical protein